MTEPVRTSGDVRSPFERDRARVIHSVAFRRLQGKTQIFAPAGADFMRTRVTHSIEVAQIGKALAKRFRVPSSLVEAACLGHDLGHPPFGHTGEQALDRCLQNHGLRYEGNAQTFRIVTFLEQKSPDYEGLDLCRATLHALLKYPYQLSAGASKFIYDEDAEREEGWLFEGYDQGFAKAYSEDDEPPRSLPCQLMDWADDIAYSVHDLEDGIASGILQPATWGHERFRAAISASLQRAPVRWKDGPPDEAAVSEVLDELHERLGCWGPVVPKDVIREFTRSQIDLFATAGDVVQIGDGGTLFDYRLDLDEEIRTRNLIFKSITFEFVILDHRTATVAFKGREIVHRLFDALMNNAMAPNRTERFTLFPREMREALAAFVGDESALARQVADHIASMTEGQALALYGRLFEPEVGSPLELV